MLVDAAATLISFGPNKVSLSEEDLEFILDTFLASRLWRGHSVIEVAMAVPLQLWRKASIAAKLGTLLCRWDRVEIIHPSLLDLLMKALEYNPKQKELLYPAALLITVEESDAKAKLEQIFSCAGPFHNEEGLYPRLASAIVQLINCSDVEACVDEVLSMAEHPRLLLSILAGELLPIEKRLTILTLVIKKLRERNSPEWRGYIPIARKGLDARKSDLTNPDVWNRKLELPPESFEILLPAVASRNAINRA